MSASPSLKKQRRERLELLESKAKFLAERLGSDASAFFEVATGRTPFETQRAVLQSDAQYIQLLCCRQWGKSTVAAVKAAHVAIYEPGSLVLITAPGDRQSSELFGKLDKIHRASLGAPKRTTDSKTQIVLENGSRIVCLPGSAETIVGYSAPRLIIIDESSRTDDAVFLSVLPMLSRSPRGQLMLLSTAYGKRGHFYSNWVSGSDTWKRFGPIVGSEVHDHTYLEEQRSLLSDYWYRQEYDCEFVEAVDSVFDHKSIHGAADSNIVPLMARAS